MSNPQAKSFRYQLPKKAIKGNCPQCGPKHRKTLSRYIDTQTGEPLPEPYGRCDRASNCGYSLSPYQKGASGLSYAEEMNPRNNIAPIPKAWFRMAGKWKKNGTTRQSMIDGFQDALVGATPDQAERIAAFIYDKSSTPTHVATAPKPVYSIPDEVFTASLGRYEHNQFAHLLTATFGPDIATTLLHRFFIGTSSRWPGACVFWYIDAQDRKRGGQIKQFDESFHTVKYVDPQGEKRSRTTWVHSAFARRCDQHGHPYPNWLTDYLDESNEVEKSPCLFGLPQLKTTPIDQPVAVVEAPKTAVICTYYFPDFVWMAIGALSYLNAERLLDLKGRTIMLFPDLSADGSAFARWSRISSELNRQGFTISVSSFLEEHATEQAREKGYDLADFLLNQDSSAVTKSSDEFDERIQGTVSPDKPVSTPFKLPASLEYKWQVFGRPPMWYNKIAAHKALQRWLEPIGPELKVVTTIADQLANPAAVLRPDESQLEQMGKSEALDYPSAWDIPNPPDAVPAIKEIKPKNGDYFIWQRSPGSPFAKLGLASLQNQNPSPYLSQDSYEN